MPDDVYALACGRGTLREEREREASRLRWRFWDEVQRLMDQSAHAGFDEIARRLEVPPARLQAIILESASARSLLWRYNRYLHGKQAYSYVEGR